MPLDPNFPLTVPDIGDFVFRKRRVPDQIRIQADALRLLGGPCDDKDLNDISIAWATLKLLIIEAPKDFLLDEMDPLDHRDTDQIWAVWRALRTEEGKFRKGA